MADTLAAVTDDGVLLASNSHGDPNEPQLVCWHPAVDGAHALLLSQPWGAWGAAAGANEYGVAIAGQPVATRGAGARPEGAPPGRDLLRLALEGAIDRREAVEVLVGLVGERGQDAGAGRGHPGARGTSFVVADPWGVTLLETAGRHWATEEVLRARSSSPALTIDGFARRHAARGRARRWASPARRARTEAAALAARSPADLQAALRDHGSGRLPDLPRYRIGGAPGGACAHAGGLLSGVQTTASWVSDLRPGRPRQAGAAGEAGTHWVTGTSAPCTSVFWPAAVGVPVDLDAGAAGGDPARDDPAYLWWRHERVHRVALRDADRTLEPLATGRAALEELWLAAPPTSVEALATAEDWRAAALEGLRALEPADTRPVRVAAQWRRWSSGAGLPGWDGLARESTHR